MQTKQEQQDQKLFTHKESRENIISVEVQRLSHGLKTTFEGVAMIFDSLGRQLDMTELNIASATSAASELSKENLENEKFQNFSAEIPAESEHADEPKEDQAEAQQSDTVETADTGQPEEAKSSITRDDIVRLVTKKLKENRDINGPKIRKIINQHDADNLTQLTEENFEAVMTEIASL